MRLGLLLTMIVPFVSAGELSTPVLTGRVLDASKASIAGATVQVTHSATGQVSAVVSDPQGNYSVRLPAAGVYAVKVGAPGFEDFVRPDLQIDASRPMTVEVVLSVAAIAEQVTVLARGPDLLETLDIRQVRESSARDVGEAVARLEGVSRIRKGGIANDIVVRGFQQENLAVLIDGARIHGACPGNMDPPASHVDFAEIQEVEITKGAFDIRNQGSLGGTVNIVNKVPPAGFRLTPSLALGSWGYVNPSITGSYSRAGKYVQAGQSYRRSNAFKDGAGKRFTEYANFRPDQHERTAFAANTVWAKGGLQPFEGHELALSYTRQDSGRVFYPYLQMDGIYDDADRMNGTYTINDLFGVVRQLRAQTYFTRVKHWMTDELRQTSVGAPRPFGMATFAATKTLGGRIEAEFSGVVAGVEAYRRNWNTVNTMRMAGVYVDQNTIPNVNLTLGGAFLDWRRTLFGRLHLNAGARFDHASTQARGRGYTDLYWAYKGTRALSAVDNDPSANFRAAYSIGRGLDFFAGIGRTSRLPDPQERFYSHRRGGSDWVGNPNLLPVRNTEVDAGFNFRHRVFSLRPTLYYSDLKDYIVIHNQPRLNMAPLIMNPAALSYENVPARMYGGELAYSASLHRSLVLLGGLSQTRGIKDALPVRRIYSRNLAEIAPFRARTALRYGSTRFFGEVENISTTAQRRVDADVREIPTAGFAVFNAKFGAHTSRLDFSIAVDNLGNRYYYEHFSFQRDPFRSGAKVPEPGRSVFLSVSYSL